MLVDPPVSALKESAGSLRRQMRRLAHRSSAMVRVAPGAERYLAEAQTPRLNIGCGGALLDGWLNVDRDPPPGAAFIDVTRRFPLPDASFDYALSEHVIEHLTLDDGRAMLRECARVLTPGGRLRISTPDLERLVALACGEVSDAGRRYLEWAASVRPRGRGSAPALMLNNAFRAWGHRFLYDADTLATALLDAGFADVTRCEYRESHDPVFAGVEGRGIDAVGIEVRTVETLAFEAALATDAAGGRRSRPA